MKKIIEVVRSIAREEEGASMVEYAIGVGFIAAALITMVGVFTGKLSTAFGKTGTHLDAVP